MPSTVAPSPRRRKKPYWLIFALCLLLAVACSREQPAPTTTEARAVPAIPVPAAPAPAGSSPNLVTAVEAVAQATIPAVAHIEVTERREVPNPYFPFQQDPFFRQFFGNRKMPRKFQRDIRGLGSGMLLDDRGYILTNNHVAGGATKIEVQLASGERFPATLVGTDPKTDLAVIRIHTDKKLPHITFGDSDQVKVGQWVVAIGHPRGLDQTVTQGIISAKHRTGITNPSGYQDFLQTDAAINPGNSGGPLLTLDGQVIGVNAAIESTSGGFQGIGFAIPSNMALHVAKQLIATGKVERGWLGIRAQDLTADLARQFDVTASQGALLTEITPKSPAAEAGLRRGDVVVAFNDQPVTDAAELRNATADAKIGSQARLTVLRGGEQQTFQARVGNLEQETRQLLASVGERLGAKVAVVPPKVATDLGLAAGLGVMVTAVEKDGPLGQAGFEPRDLILAVNGKPVTGLDSFGRLVGRLHSAQKVDLVAVDHRTGQEGDVVVTTR